MKKCLISFVLSLLVCGLVVAGEDTTGLAYVTIAAPATYTNATTYSIAEGAATTNTLNIGKYKGNATLVISKSADLTGVSITNSSSIFLQHSTSPTGTYSSVSGKSSSLGASGTTAGVYTISVDLASLHNYVRLGATLLATNSVQQSISGVLVCPHVD